MNTAEKIIAIQDEKIKILKELFELELKRTRSLKAVFKELEA